MLVLGIETSCDETSVAVVRDGREILSNIIASQIELHRPFGGVVPEIASRQHLRYIDHIIQDALDAAKVTLDQIEAVAVTRGPGLATSLLIGISTAKAIASARKLPFLGVNHLEGHLLSPFLSSGTRLSTLDSRPFVALIVSGGHTLLVHVRGIGNYEIMGQTVDDAAGEAFDKVAKLLGLGYPGGPEIDKLAREGNRAAIAFPRSMQHSGDYNFSFSGIKTAVLYYLKKRSALSTQHSALADVCASFQEAVVDVLVEKTIAAAREKGVTLVTAAGGVTCNRRLRERLAAACQQKGLHLSLADAKLCTDNAAMIAAVADAHLRRGNRDDLTLDVEPNLALA
ncbi:MAG: tRNA (adenosine(37)-N6)-threonylcarbamoyltransferase complex transferase subunit TsaD [Verrucomicrobiae bacterium]|nr:tRNA (adenosine(37)-N6)-threonylcarbamoyltransferase complex transferase subunit TsaD [Verrucomicrobiae bacterium]